MAVLLRLAAVAVVCVLGAAPMRAQDAAELLLRLDRLENDNRRLTGQVEELSFQVRRLEEALRRAQIDGGEEPRGAPRVPVVPGPQATGPARGRGDAFDPALAPGAPGAPRPLGTPGSGSFVVGPDAAPRGTVRAGSLPAGALPPGAVADEPPLDLSTPPARPQVPRSAATVSGNPRTDYASARALLDRGDLEGAETALRAFLRSHPRDRQVPEALYALGETYYERTRYREAAEQYLSITSEHATSPRAPEAMLRLGMSLRGLGARDEACGTFAQVTRKYPQSSAALRAAVERERKRAGC